ncbi:MAG: stage II sporulation protein M [Clostridiales bacterium]
MNEKKFIKNNIHKWKSFESTLMKLTSRGFLNFDNNELENFIGNYHIICGNLSYSRTNYKNSDTTIFLNNLVATAHSYIYLKKPSKLKSTYIFFTKEFPLLILEMKYYFLISFLIFFSGFLISFIFTFENPDYSLAFIPEKYASIDFSKSKVDITLSNAAFASNVLTNNIKVGIFAFSLGITLGIGTTWILIKNSFVFGSLAALAFKQNLNLIFWSQVLPHGILEIFSILICGTSGLIMGYSLINPGEYSRKNSLIHKGKIAIKLTLGTIPIFIIAALVEGFITTNKWSDPTKIAFSIFTLILIFAYIFIPSKIHSKENLKNKKNISTF